MQPSDQAYNISVIIPVYGVEKFIERCVRSLFEQNMQKGIEYIFVDDCSPDNSINILQQLLEKDYPDQQRNVTIIKNKVNEGVSNSRQKALSIARGEYIIHCDPDDWVEKEIYEELYRVAKEKNADMVVCDFSHIQENGDIDIKSQKPLELTGQSILESICGVNHHNLMGSLCNKLIKREIAVKGHFPYRINYCEDVYFLTQILIQNQLSITYLNKSLYNYYIATPNSLVKTYTEQAVKMDLNLIDLMLKVPTVHNWEKTCIHSFIIATIFSRAFIRGTMDNQTFVRHYAKYKGFLKSNKQISKVNRILLELSLRGLYKQSKTIHKILSKLKSKL